MIIISPDSLSNLNQIRASFLIRANRQHRGSRGTFRHTLFFTQDNEYQLLLTETLGLGSVPLVPVAVDSGLAHHVVATVAAEPVGAALEHGHEAAEGETHPEHRILIAAGS